MSFIGLRISYDDLPSRLGAQGVHGGGRQWFSDKNFHLYFLKASRHQAPYAVQFAATASFGSATSLYTFCAAATPVPNRTGYPCAAKMISSSATIAKRSWKSK